MNTINCTLPELSIAFTEWERRFREEPEKFLSDMEKAAKSPESYGDSAAPYLASILTEQRQAYAKPPFTGLRGT